MTGTLYRLGAALAVLVPAVASAETLTVTPDDDVAAALDAVQPGDEVVFEEGTYDFPNGIELVLPGTQDEPILVRGADGAIPVLSSESGEFAVRITGANFTFRGFDVSGGGTALSLDVADATLTDLLVTDATDGIVCENCASTVIDSSEFTNLGGGGSGAAIRAMAMTESDVRNNWIHDLVDDAEGIVVSGSSWDNAIIDNVVESLTNTGIRVEHPVDDSEAGPPSLIGGNWLREVDGGIAATGRAFVSNNIVSDFRGSGIHATLGTPTEGVDFEISHNTVVGGTQTCFRGTDWALAAQPNFVANNALYCAGGTAILLDAGGGMQTIVRGNVYLGTADVPGDSIMGNSPGTDFEDPANGNYYPASNSPLVDAAIELYVVSPDFNGVDRPLAADAGAYERVGASNPVPRPGGGFKSDPTGGEGDAVEEPDEPADAGNGSGGKSGGGATGFPPREGEGCSCNTGGGAAVLLLPLFLLGRRRDRDA